MAAALKDFVTTFSCPKEVISDNGKEFMNSVIKEFCELLRIKHSSICAYRPSANGLVERHNQSVISILRYLVLDNPHSWAQFLDSVAFALNTAFNRNVGDTPYFLVFQQDARMPEDLIRRKETVPIYNTDCFRSYYHHISQRSFQVVQRFLDQCAEKHKLEYDKRHKTKSRPLTVGMRVYCRQRVRESKLDSKFRGPFRVKDVAKDVITLNSIVDPDKTFRVHASEIHFVDERDLTTNENGNIDRAYPVHDNNQWPI